MRIKNKAKHFFVRNSLVFIVVRAIYTVTRKIYEGSFSLLFRIFSIQQNKIVIQSVNHPSDAATWTDLSAIAAKSIQIAEDQTEHGNTGTTAYQAELRRMMEQHFRQ